MNIMNVIKRVVKWHGKMELSCVSLNQNRTATLGLIEALAPEEEASKVNL